MTRTMVRRLHGGGAVAPGARLAVLAALVAACAGPGLPRTPRGPVVLEVRGDVKRGPFRLGDADLAALKQRNVRGVDPATGREGSFQGVDLAALDERVESTRGADTLVVHTGDRRAVAIPLSVVRELRPVLAPAPAGAPGPAGRLLAWPNVEHHGLTSDPRAPLWWARGVVAVEYVSWARTFGRALRVPEGAPAGSLAGAAAFGTRCIGCHAVRGVGGAAGPDLTRGGVAPTEARLGTLLPGHPGWAPAGVRFPDGPTIAHLAAFLGTVARTPSVEDEREQEEPTTPEPEPDVTLPR